MASALIPAEPVVVESLAAVEAALGRLWQARAAAGDRAVLRAATFNLVVLVGGEVEGQEAAAVLADVTADHPGRVLILSLDPAAAADRFTAWVTSHCRLVGDGALVCGEQVVISAAGRAVERLGSAVPVLFVPDCPAVTWWRCGPGPAAALLDRLLPGLDAVLIDGTRFDAATLPRWTARLGDGRDPVLGDLAWQRGAPWRSWLADCFEDPIPRAALRDVGAVRVEHGPGGEMIARLFVGWLAARLGRQLDVTVGPGGAAGGLTGLELEGPGLRCEIRRDGASVGVTVTHGGAVTRRVFRHREPDEAALVGDWLAYPRWDPAYGEALASLATLAR